jgi:glyoxylase-like metal-dependent hydrolase (beta-lactamase superfamily II)
MDTEEARGVWQSVSQYLGLKPGTVTAVVITHFHPDHVGLAGYAQALWDCPVMMLEEERQTVYALFDGNPPLLHDFFVHNGLPADDAEFLDQERWLTQSVVHLPENPRIMGLHTDSRLGDYQILEQKGHTDHQLLLYLPDRKILLTGDQVLSRITPNISFWPGSDPNPLGSYLQSLQQLQALPVTLGLPAHESLIPDVAGRIEALISHHRERTQQVLEILAAPHDAYTLSQKLFHRPLTRSQWRFALSESLAHLEFLRNQGQVEVEWQDEIRIYRRTGGQSTD